MVVAEKNLFALSKILGDKKYFFSDTQIHLLDIICFAELTQLITVKNKDIEDLLARFPNLMALQQSIKDQYWNKDEAKWY